MKIFTTFPMKNLVKKKKYYCSKILELQTAALTYHKIHNYTFHETNRKVYFSDNNFSTDKLEQVGNVVRDKF